jgi:spore germination cell wall hydrolase CwlJ-like protein
VILALLRKPAFRRASCIVCAVVGVGALAGLAPAPRAVALRPARHAATAAPAPQSAPGPAAPALSPLDRSDEASASQPDVARKLNAALPTSRAPRETARPFHLPAQGLDRARAVECLTAAIYYEAGYEPIEGRRAVAQVVLNRLRHPAFPKTICGVVFEGADHSGCQFSFACDGPPARAPDPAAFGRARQVAEEALAGRVEPLIGTATHYHADYVAPYWRRSLEKIRQIGTHIFYRWPGGAGTRAAFVGRYLGDEPAPITRGQIRTAFARAQGAGPDESPAERAGKIIPGLGWTPNVAPPSTADSAYHRLMVEQSGGSGASDGRS